MRFTSMTRPNSSGVVSSKVAKSPTAARCTQVSSLPYSSTARSATAFTCSKSEVSATTAIASPPSRRISSTRESSPSSLRAETTTLAPLLANRRAVSRPMPLEAPIRATTCSSTGLRSTVVIGDPFATFPASELDRIQSRGLSTGDPFSEESTHDRHEGSRLLDVRQVTTVGEEFERALLQEGERLFPLPVREHPILYSPHDKRRHR